VRSYEELARFYDALTQDVDREKWADYFQEHFRRSGKDVHLVLDLACGTGTMSCLLARRGFDVIGVDRSEEMLMEAFDKAAGMTEERPMFLQQSMAELDLYGTVDAAVCCLDSVNYVTDPQELQTAFDRVHLFLDPGGIFLFDVNSPYKFRQMDGELYLDENEEVCCLWRVDLEGDLCTYQVDLFERTEEDLWARSTEEHVERLYRPEDLRRMLERAGFRDIEVFGDLTFDAPQPEDMRIFFKARKEN